MTKQDIKNKMKSINVWKVMTAVMTIAFLIAGMTLVKERAYNEGYNDAYNTGLADGWQGCIEENNLYDRY